ncbi:MAG: cadherin-like domain-containing protein [Pirellulales bacterium]
MFKNLFSSGRRSHRTIRRRKANRLFEQLENRVYLSANDPGELFDVVVPNALETVEGNDASEFLTGDRRAVSIRYQQVFAASQFAEGGAITQIAFRPEAARGTAFSGTLSNVRIGLSTTSRMPDDLNAAFANNVGSDEIVVFSGDLTLSSADVPGPGGTRAFDIVISLSTPFTYDPTRGNLLLDFQRDGSSLHPLGVSFNAQNEAGDPISRAFGSRGSSTAEFGIDTFGVVARFSLVPQAATVVATDDNYQVDEDRTLEVSAATGVLANDSGPSGSTLNAALVAGPINGSVNLNADGSFTYTPAHDFFGIDTFTYTASDGQSVSEEATVTITVNSVLDVLIGVRPGSESNSVNLNSNGRIAVAIFTSATFDATAVNAATVVFAGASAEQWSLEDVDGDGDTDLLLQFRTQETNLRAIYEQLLAEDNDADGILDSNHQQVSVSLTGMTARDELFDGADELDLFLSGRALRDLLDALAAEGEI